MSPKRMALCCLLPLLAACFDEVPPPPDLPGGTGGTGGAGGTLIVWNHPMLENGGFKADLNPEHKFRAEQVWKTCNINVSFQLSNKGTVDETGTNAQSNPVKLGFEFYLVPTNWGKLQNWKEKVQPAAGVDVFYTRNITAVPPTPSPVGVTQDIGGNTVVIKSPSASGTDAYSLAHELGHVLNLHHHPDPNNLMYNPVQYGGTWTGFALNSAQCDTARQYGNAHWY